MLLLLLHWLPAVACGAQMQRGCKFRMFGESLGVGLCSWMYVWACMRFGSMELCKRCLGEERRCHLLFYWALQRDHNWHPCTLMHILQSMVTPAVSIWLQGLLSAGMTRGCSIPCCCILGVNAAAAS